jgi:hypothetical protein
MYLLLCHLILDLVIISQPLHLVYPYFVTREHDNKILRQLVEILRLLRRVHVVKYVLGCFKLAEGHEVKILWVQKWRLLLNGGLPKIEDGWILQIKE